MNDQAKQQVKIATLARTAQVLQQADPDEALRLHTALLEKLTGHTHATVQLAIASFVGEYFKRCDPEPVIGAAAAWSTALDYIENGPKP